MSSEHATSAPSFMQLNDVDDIKQQHPTAKIIQLPIACVKDKYVSIINNAFSKQECAELISWSENVGYNDALVNLGFGHKHEIIEFRKHKKISVDNKTMAAFIFNRCKDFIPKQFANRSVVDINERLRFLRYGDNEYFGAHYDGMYVRDHNQQRSLITIIMYLNDNFDGGEITFLHPTNENISHSIHPKTGMVLLFEQSELFHQGNMVKHTNAKQDPYKYCIRSDIMYSKHIIDVNKPSSTIPKSYQIDKQTAYFERQALKHTDQKWKISKHANRIFTRHNIQRLTKQIVSYWLIEAAAYNLYLHPYNTPFPVELHVIIDKYLPILSVLDIAHNTADLFRLAQISETAERYGEMCQIMTELVELNCYVMRYDFDDNAIVTQNILSVEGRKLLKIAFKNIITPIRAAWRNIKGRIDTINGVTTYLNRYTSEEKKQDVLFMDEERKKQQLCVCSEYVKVIETDWLETCQKMVDLLEHHVLRTLAHCKTERSVDSMWYLKMAADYYQYMAEINRVQYKDKSEMYYERAVVLSNELLLPTHPDRLGLGLNYSVFLYETKKDAIKACTIAKEAFDGAINELDQLSDEDYKDSTLIMRLLRDNLTLWTQDTLNESENQTN